MNISMHLTWQTFLKLTVDYGPKIATTARAMAERNQTSEALLRVEQKVDAAIIQEIQSALRIIDGMSQIASPAMVERHRDEAEAMLLRHISHDDALIIAGQPGGYWSAQAYYGLACIAHLRSELDDAARFMLHTFVSSPRVARQILAPGLYAEAFESQCEDILGAYEANMERLPSLDWEREVVGKQVRNANLKLLGFGGLSIAAQLFGPKSNMPFNPARTNQMIMMNRLRQEVEQLQRRRDALPTRQQFEAERDDALDARCNAFATRLLEESRGR